MIKTLSKLVIIQENYNLNKKASVNDIVSGWRLNSFPLRSGTKQGCPRSLLLLNIELGSSSHCSKTWKKSERHIAGKRINKHESRLSVQPLLSRLCHRGKGKSLRSMELGEELRNRSRQISPAHFKVYLFIFGFLGLHCCVGFLLGARASL